MANKLTADDLSLAGTGEVSGTKLSGKRGLDVSCLPCGLEVDYTSTVSVVYVGVASVGSVTSDPVWQIVRYDLSSGVSTGYSDGDILFDNVWDDRVSLSYS